MKRPDSCIGCPLNETSTPGFCPDKISAKAKYLFIAEAPGSTEVSKAEPMVGQAGFVLSNWLVKAVSPIKLAWDKGEVGLANVLRCLPKEVQGRPYPKGKDKEAAERHCRQYDNWPESVHTYVLFGENSQRLFFREELEAEDAEDKQLGHTVKGVLGRVGRVYTKDTKRFVFAPHPAYILRQPSLVSHGQQALQIAANTESVLNVNLMSWEQALEKML